jgi:hypothetical protein
MDQQLALVVGFIGVEIGLDDADFVGCHGVEYGGVFRPWYGRGSAALVSRYHQGRRRSAGGDPHPQPQPPAGLHDWQRRHGRRLPPLAGGH